MGGASVKAPRAGGAFRRVATAACAGVSARPRAAVRRREPRRRPPCSALAARGALLRCSVRAPGRLVLTRCAHASVRGLGRLLARARAAAQPAATRDVLGAGALLLDDRGVVLERQLHPPLGGDAGLPLATAFQRGAR